MSPADRGQPEPQGPSRFGLGAQRCAPCLHPAPGAAGFVLLNRRSRHTLSKTEMRVLAQPPGPRRFQKYAERYGRSDETSRSTKTSLVRELEGTWAALCRCTGQLC